MYRAGRTSYDHDQPYVPKGPQAAESTVHSVEFHEDETGRLKQTEARLQRCEEFVRSVLEGSSDCIQVLDLEGRIEFVSRSCLRAREITEGEELLGSRWADLWQPQDRLRAEAALSAALAKGTGRFTGEWVSTRGIRRAFDVTITAARDTEGRVERLIAIACDLTEVRVAQQAVIESERQAGAGRLAATIAHEINNPLEAVTNFIFLAMESGGLPEEARRYLEMADRELTRAAQIARQTLGFYRGNSQPRWVSLSELIHDVASMYSRKLHTKQLRLSVSVDPRLEVYGKDGELRQILLNLTANAVDASDPGGKLWFRAHRTANWKGDGEGIRITVADNGTGMSPEVQRRIFMPFFTTKAGTGTGIGLWVTKCLVEQRGGYVHARSSQGKSRGTVMALFLPAARQTTEAIAEVA